MTTPMIEIQGLRKSFGTLEVLRDINFTVAPGGVVALIGPSGSGKSTLLRCVNLLVTPDSGRISVGDTTFDFGARGGRPRTKALAAFRARTGMVFQSFNLFGHLTVLGNVMEAPVRVRRLPKAAARDLAMAQLDTVGLADRADQMPHTLSGGRHPDPQERTPLEGGLPCCPRPQRHPAGEQTLWPDELEALGWL